MTTLNIILTELRRQHDESRANGLGWFDDDDPRHAIIDGAVDLVALAAAIDQPRAPADWDGKKGA